MFRETASKHQKIPPVRVRSFAQSPRTFLTLLINLFAGSLRSAERHVWVQWPPTMPESHYAFTLGRVCCSHPNPPLPSSYPLSALASLRDMWSACYPDRALSRRAHIWTAWVCVHVCKASPMLGCGDEFGRINTGPPPPCPCKLALGSLQQKKEGGGNEPTQWAKIKLEKSKI